MAFANIQEELKKQNVQLVAVSKTKPADQILALYNSGQRVFGENRVQEIIEKAPLLPKDIDWHFIGHLQTKKVKQIVSLVSMIQSVDSLKLLEEINKRAEMIDRTIDVLLQFHVAREMSKYGFRPEDLEFVSEQIRVSQVKNIRVRGVMGMATFTDEERQIRKEFKLLRSVFEALHHHQPDEFKADFDICSMGMSGDYSLAIEEGSTMVRLGSVIFGKRN